MLTGLYNLLNHSYRLTDGYSGSDLNALAKDAALGPIRGKYGDLNIDCIPVMHTGMHVIDKVFSNKGM